MIELSRDSLVFSFPGLHPQARLRLTFHRTLRIPDDGRSWPLPPSLGAFPLRHVDDVAERVPPAWLRRGGVMLPMYQSEALWIDFHSDRLDDHESPWPFAIKIAAGKVNAASGEDWREGLHRGPQDYLVAPGQPWLDGWCVEEGFIRQFVAMPLGSGFSVEEQLAGTAEHGGVQVLVHPMRREAFLRRFPKVVRHERAAMACRCPPPAACGAPAPDMGLGAGGRMRQELYRDRFALDEWDEQSGSRCFVHLCNSLVWQSLTGAPPPHPPPTAEAYTRAGLPWFAFYADGLQALPGSERLAGVKSVATLAAEKGQVVLPENQCPEPPNVVQLRAGLLPGQVREGGF